MYNLIPPNPQTPHSCHRAALWCMNIQDRAPLGTTVFEKQPLQELFCPICSEIMREAMQPVPLRPLVLRQVPEGTPRERRWMLPRLQRLVSPSPPPQPVPLALLKTPHPHSCTIMNLLNGGVVIRVFVLRDTPARPMCRCERKPHRAAACAQGPDLRPQRSIAGKQSTHPFRH